MADTEEKSSREGSSKQESLNEKSLLVKKSPDAKQVERYRKLTLATSVITLIGLLALGIAALVESFQFHSSASFAFALGALLDCCSSGVVLWRYLGSASIYSKSKERNACLILGVLFITSAVVIIIRASIALMSETKPGSEQALFIIAHISAVFCALLCLAKSYLAYKLSSISIATDAVNSAIGALLAIGTLTSEYVYEIHPDIWQVDHIASIVCSAFLVGYGIWILVYELREDNRESSDSESEG